VVDYLVYTLLSIFLDILWLRTFVLDIGQRLGLMAAAPGMQDDLRELLTANLVPAECINLLQTDGCSTLKLFAKWAPDRATVQAVILDKCPSVKTSVQALASLLQAGDEAIAIVAEVVKRSAAGLDPEHADEPLLFVVQQALEAKFTARYSWTLEPKYQPCNSLIGRVRREFEKWSPTIFNLHRVKTVFTTNKVHEPKKRRLATGITFTLEVDEEADDVQSNKFRHIMAKYEVLALAWGIAGNYEVDHNGSKTDMCSWQQARRYVRTLREKSEMLLDAHDESSVVHFLLAVEEQIRGYAVEYTRRTPPTPWGLSLELALRENKDLWMDFRHLLTGNKMAGPRSIDKEDLPVQQSVQVIRQTKERQAPKASMNKNNMNKQSQSPRKGTNEQKASSSSGLATATHTNAGSVICKAWNDSRGCSKPCSSGKAHVCDIVVAKTNSVCGRSDHNRKGHNPSTHGACASRQ
jgi:hypothetical protein